jgi:hypothetical protein
MQTGGVNDRNLIVRATITVITFAKPLNDADIRTLQKL